VTAILHPDGSLASAGQQLGDAVRAMADPIPEWMNGAAYWADPLYVRLRVALSGNRSVDRRALQRRSRLPCRVDVLALLCEIDDTVAAWTPDAKGGTVERLHQLAGRGWRPQDCALMTFYVGEIGRWVVAAEGLLAPPVRVDLHMPCPSCGARFAYLDDDAGDEMRVWALRVSETGCRCRACQAFWPPERFEFLARLLEGSA
jgi:hypothetical protein